MYMAVTARQSFDFCLVFLLFKDIKGPLEFVATAIYQFYFRQPFSWLLAGPALIAPDLLGSVVQSAADSNIMHTYYSVDKRSWYIDHCIDDLVTVKY